MSSNFKKQVSALILLIALTSHCLAAESELREWKSNQGSTITAQAVYVGDQLIVLKNKDGKEISVSIDSLSAKDRDFLQSLKSTDSANKATEEVSPKPTMPDTTDTEKSEEVDPEKKQANQSEATGQFLPKLTEGEGTGNHAYYKGEKFIAKIDSKGTLFVYYLDEDGKEVADWKIVIHSQSFTRLKGKLKRFSFEKVITHDKPQLNPKEVKFTFMREGDITSDIIYEFNPKGFTTWTRSVTTKDSPIDVKHIMRHLFPPIEKLSTEASFTKKTVIEIEDMKGNEEKFTFEDVELPKGNTSKFEIKGPLFGKSKLIIERCEDKKSKFIINPYPGSPLKSGFTIFNSKEDYGSNDHENEKTTFTFK